MRDEFARGAEPRGITQRVTKDGVILLGVQCAFLVDIRTPNRIILGQLLQDILLVYHMAVVSSAGTRRDGGIAKSLTVIRRC